MLFSNSIRPQVTTRTAVNHNASAADLTVLDLLVTDGADHDSDGQEDAASDHNTRLRFREGSLRRGVEDQLNTSSIARHKQSAGDERNACRI